jgi:hypothetical protein
LSICTAATAVKATYRRRGRFVRRRSYPRPQSFPFNYTRRRKFLNLSVTSRLKFKSMYFRTVTRTAEAVDGRIT